MAQVRHRPQYRYLKHDLRNEPGGRRGVKCSKYYSKYGEQRLTGGIMCVWCTHSVCYGFHCIPHSEGWNGGRGGVVVTPLAEPTSYMQALFAAINAV